MFSVPTPTTLNSGAVLQKSAFQNFVDGVQALYPERGIREILAQYPTPQLVMIGSESTGKSATLESLTQKGIFPTDQKTCTRCPIKVSMIPTSTGQAASVTVTFRNTTLKVKDAVDLRQQMKGIFDRIRTETSTGYCTDEIEITFIEPNAVRIDLVDLPGLVSFPESAKKFTTDMCLKYIKDPNSLIICVATATHPRLNSYEPIARILENKAEDRTIITLTMCDKLHHSDYDSHIKSRVTLTADEFHGSKFLACCAVVNRANATASLPEQPAAEKKFFAEHLLSNATVQEVTALSRRLGVDRLQDVAKTLYEKFLRERWVPTTAQQIQDNIKKLQNQAADIGTEVNVSTINQLQQHIGSSADVGAVLQSLYDCFKSTTATNTQPNHYYQHQQSVADPLNLFGQALTLESIITYDFIKDFEKNTIARVDAFDMASALSKYNNATWKLQRFTAFWAQVKKTMKEMIRGLIADGLRALQPFILTNFLTATANNSQGYNNYHYQSYPQQYPHYDAPETLLKQLFAVFKQRCVALVTVANMVEDAAVVKKRCELQQQITRSAGVRDALLQTTKEGRIEVVGTASRTR